MTTNTHVIYDYIESLDSSSENDIELFKHFLCEQLYEMKLTEEQLEYMQDKVDTIDIQNQLDWIKSKNVI